MADLIMDECGLDSKEDRFIIIGCEDIPGFEAVAYGAKVDTAKVGPGMVNKALSVIDKYPNIRCILMECTELPPYSDAVRAATGLPVFDAITGCDLFLNSFIDNPRFGIDNWQKAWDGQQVGLDRRPSCTSSS